MCRFLKVAVAYSEPTTKLQGKLASFADLVVADATVITLHDFLQKSYNACRTNHSKAALKLHMVISVLAAGPRCVQVFSERLKEVKHFRIGPWVRDRLLLMDLGYYCFSLFERIARNGGFLISRVKDNAKFVIVATNRKWRGRSLDIVGKKLQDVSTVRCWT